MGNTIKDIEVIAYKGIDFNMSCRGFHYEVGKSYKTDKAELCKWGFHACLNPIYVLSYYPIYVSSRYFKVKLSGEITQCDNLDTKVAATEITIIEEITDTFNEAIKTEWWKNDNVLDLLYFSDGFARIKRGDDLCNFINKDGKIISEKWFDWVGDFKDGVAIVEREDGKFNLINRQGKILSEQWFNELYDVCRSV